MPDSQFASLSSSWGAAVGLAPPPSLLTLEAPASGQEALPKFLSPEKTHEVAGLVLLAMASCAVQGWHHTPTLTGEETEARGGMVTNGSRARGAAGLWQTLLLLQM